MTRGIRLAAAGTLVLLLACPSLARAFDEQRVMSCAFQQALAILTCKTPEKYSFLGVREGVYIYNSLYGRGFAEFYVQINGDLAIFSSRVWNGPYAFRPHHPRLPRRLRDHRSGAVALLPDQNRPLLRQPLGKRPPAGESLQAAQPGRQGQNGDQRIEDPGAAGNEAVGHAGQQNHGVEAGFQVAAHAAGFGPALEVEQVSRRVFRAGAGVVQVRRIGAGCPVGLKLVAADRAKSRVIGAFGPAFAASHACVSPPR